MNKNHWKIVGTKGTAYIVEYVRNGKLRKRKVIKLNVKKEYNDYIKLGDDW